MRRGEELLRKQRIHVVKEWSQSLWVSQACEVSAGPWEKRIPTD